MHFRNATTNDIPHLHRVRLSVTENALSNPELITENDYREFLEQRGKGWVCETEGAIVGFAIADLQGRNIWALFLDPAFERRGIGRALHTLMLDWYFSQTGDAVWLSTAPQSRAEGFYRTAGWNEAGTYGKGELRFEMCREDWQQRKTASNCIPHGAF